MMNKLRPTRALSRAISISFFTTTTSFPLKNVTKSNFETTLAELKSHVQASDFVAIDLEMTGVTSAPWRESFEFDRYDVRYLKVKDSAEKFAVVQFGVCPFRWDSSKHSFIAHPHNFYVFRRQEIQVDGPAFEFLCQTTSIDFLAKYQFDFNACIHEGISYLSRAQEDEALRRLNLEYEDEFSDDKLIVTKIRDERLVRMADILFTERMKKRICEWRDGLLREGNGEFGIRGGSNELEQEIQTIFFKRHPALSLNGFTSHQLRLIQLVIRRHFEDLCYVRVNNDNAVSKQLVVYTDSKYDKNLLMNEVKDGQRREREMKIQAAIGFRYVIDLLSSENKLIVGHNCFLDIAHIYSKFIGPLPSTAEEFVSSVNKHFPFIADTKILLNGNHLLKLRMKKSRTSLSSAFASLCPQIALGSESTCLSSISSVQVEVRVDDFRSSNWNSGAKHEAGYDAFMTGCVFAQACTHLGVDFRLLSSSENLCHNEKLHKYMNHLYLSWNNGEIIDLCSGNRITDLFGGSIISPKMRYPKITFENIVLIWGFPTKLNARKIRECISKVFGPLSIVSVYHLDESAVFVQFSKAESVSEFLLLKESLEKRDDPISVLHPLAELLEGGNTCAAGYEIYKEICRSPISELLFADQAQAIGIKWKTKLLDSRVAAECQAHRSPNSIVSKAKDILLDEKTDPPKRDNENNTTCFGRYDTLDSLC